MDTKLNILMPVYNAAAWLENTVECIRNQTFQYWSLIIINDGSTDSSGEICDRFAQKDSRIRIIHQSNKGVSRTRNELLKYINAKYVTFVDADDIIEENMYEILITKMEEQDVDLVTCQYIRREEKDGEINDTYYKYYYNDYVQMRDLKKTIHEFFETTIINSLCNKLYKSSVIKENNLNFKGLDVGEDLLFNLDYLKCISKLGFCEEALYIYIKREGSTTQSYISNLFENSIMIQNEIRKFLVKMDMLTPELKKSINDAYMRLFYETGLNLFASNCPLSIFEKKLIIDKMLKNKEYISYIKKYKIRHGEKILFITKLVSQSKNSYLILLYFKFLTTLKKILSNNLRKSNN